MANLKGLLVFGAAAVMICAISNRGEGAQTYEFTGTVSSVKPDEIAVRRGEEEARFSRPKDLSRVRVGDRITVIYEMNAKQVKPAHEAAGEVAPNQRTILDDRAFYNAKNQAKPLNEKNPG